MEVAPDNFVPLKKKGEGDAYFAGGKGKSKAKKGPKVHNTTVPEADTEAGKPNEQQKTGALSRSSRHAHDPGTGSREKWEEQAGRRPGSQRQSNGGRASTRGGRRGSPSQREESKDGSMGRVLVPGAVSKTQAIQQLKANKATRRPGKGPGKKAQET